MESEESRGSGDDRCLELALAGEDAIRRGDLEEGIKHLESALGVGTTSFTTISAVYSQLGNAYYAKRNYAKALEYHRFDFQLARHTSDRMGEAKSAGNLANTLRQLGCFEEAEVCGMRQLNIARETKDKQMEARALYTLGNIFYAKGRHMGLSQGFQDSASPHLQSFPKNVADTLSDAVEFLQENLKLVQELNDEPGKGRAYGNLGNTHYLLGQYKQAIQAHKARLRIARQFDDKAAIRRAHTNLGNAHVFLQEYEEALFNYRKALDVSRELGERWTEAQCFYSIGNTSALLGEWEEAKFAHLEHLAIARELKDSVGEARAASSLTQAHSQLKAPLRAAYFAMLHAHLSASIGDESGMQAARAALSSLHIQDLSEADVSADPSPRVELSQLVSEAEAPTPSPAQAQAPTPLPPPRTKRGENLSLPHSISAHPDGNALKGPGVEQVDDMFDLICRSNTRRIDGQRANPQALEDKENRPRRMADAPRPVGGGDSSPEDFLDLVAHIQGRRIDDQRAALPFLPGLQNPERLTAAANANQQASLAGPSPSSSHPPQQGQEDFFDMLVRCQGARMDGQRSELGRRDSAQAAATLPDGDIFSEIMRAQQRRMDEQRGDLSSSSAVKSLQEPPQSSSASSQASHSQPASATHPSPEFKQPHKRTASHKIKKR